MNRLDRGVPRFFTLFFLVLWFTQFTMLRVYDVHDLVAVSFFVTVMQCSA